ncbi:MAG: tetratricopeptide repeat protein [bacterium]|nr:tetratricopeptide repeat protein [bacterium]
MSNHNLFRTHTVRWAQENFNAGSFYFSRQNYDAAKQYFEKSLSYDESYTPALLNLASTYIQTQRYEEGLTDFLQMYRASKTAQWPIPYGITQLLFASGNLEEAERWGIKICQNYPDQPECYNLLGSIYFSQSDFPHAEEILRKGISRFPHASQLFSNLGSVLLREKSILKPYKC